MLRPRSPVTVLLCVSTQTVIFLSDDVYPSSKVFSVSAALFSGDVVLPGRGLVRQVLTLTNLRFESDNGML